MYYKSISVKERLPEIDKSKPNKYITNAGEVCFDSFGWDSSKEIIFWLEPIEYPLTEEELKKQIEDTLCEVLPVSLDEEQLESVVVALALIYKKAVISHPIRSKQ